MSKHLPRVALLIESSRNYGRGVLRGIARYSRTNGPWSCFTQERELHSGIPEWLRTWKGDGIIARIEEQRTAKALLKLGLPVVDVLGNARFKHVPGFDTDAGGVARLVGEFFLRAGFQYFAYCGYPGIPFSNRRAEAFATYLAGHGRELRVFKTRIAKNRSSNIQAIEQSGLGTEAAIAGWLKKQPRPLALFACNDIRAQQVLNACREHRIKVPEEVAVIGVDNDDVLCNLCDPPLTSIEPDTERLGYEAAALLDRMMKGKVAGDGPIRQVPPLRILERASTDVVAIDDPITVRAVRFIRDHIGDGIAAKDVMTHVGRSRTDLEQRFQRWLKLSVRSEIMRRRMDRVCALLQQTNLGLNEIADRAGFSTAAHLCRLFQQRLKQSPTEYRNACKIRQ